MRPLADIAAELANFSTGLQRIADELREPPTSYTVVTPGMPIQPTLDAALPGHEIRLVSGARYPGNIRIEKPVTIRGMNLDGLGDQRVTPAAGPAMPMIVPTTGAPLIDIVPGVEGVHLSRFACDPANLNDVITIGHGDNSQTSLDRQPRQIILSQLLMAASPTQSPKRGIGLHAYDVIVQRCHISGMKRIGQDTQAIAGWNGQGAYSLINNYLEAAGETVMFGGSDPDIPGLVPSSIVLAQNTITKDLAWRGSTWTVKNLIELKAARDVTIRRNLITNCWRAAHQGYAFMFTVQSQDGRNPNVIVDDVLVEQNEVRNVGAGINLLGYAQNFTSQQSRGFQIRDNWFQIEQALGAQAWFLFLSREPRDVDVEHNTIESTSTNAIVKHEGAPVQGFRFVGNLVPRCGEYGFSGFTGSTVEHFATRVGVYLPAAPISTNAFGSFPRPANLPGNTHVSSGVITTEDGFGTGPFETFGRRRAA